MSKGYLEQLDARLAAGAAGLGATFAPPRAGFVLARQAADGGFVGRRGGSDVYYTDFALRTLALLGRDGNVAERTRLFVRRLPGPPRDLVECFNRLNCHRLLGDPLPPAAPYVAGISRPVAGPYDAFLAALCGQMLGLALPQPDAAVRAILAARTPDGGFAGASEQPAGQTNPSAAAVAALRIHGAVTPDLARRAADFLCAMQSPTGGFVAHAAATEPDLLSTFTALVALGGLGAFHRADLPGVGRFIKALAAADGGFRGSPSDPETDVEYTYYGVGAAALLRAHASA